MAGNWLDRAIGFVSPGLGYRRARARVAMEALGGVVQTVRRTAASRQGTLANFLPSRLNPYTVERDADLIRDRAESLVASDGLAAACIDTLALNVVGSGLRPQSTPDVAALGGLSDDEADAFAESAERAWDIWCREADAADTDHFNDLQYQAVHSMAALGEFLHLPVWIDSPDRHFGLAIQTLHPGRLRTPADLQANPRIRRGVEIGDYGSPVAYWLAEPPDNRSLVGLTSANFRRVPRKIAHRWGCFHRRHANGPEQLRGETRLSPSMKLFSDLSAYVDSELVGAVVAASLTVFMETAGNPFGDVVELNGSKKKSLYGPYPKELVPGSVLTGRPGDKPHLLANPRPGQSFDPFMARLSKLVTASTGQPFITVFKDFSDTNYSSMRGALLEVCRLYTLYQDWLVRGYLDHLYAMTLEEAFLRGMLAMPKGRPDFYAARDAWCAATWTRPPRGQIEPVKERSAEKMGTDAMTDSVTDILYSRGTDPETMARKIARERRIYAKQGLVLAPTTTPVAAPAQSQAKNDAEQGQTSKEQAA